jgi:hypothetical protein
MRIRSYSDNDIIEAVKTSTSIRQVLIKIGLVGKGGNYKIIHRSIKRLGLDTNHFTGQGHLKGKSNDWAPKIPFDKILIENSPYLNTSCLRQRLIKEGLKEARCECCGNTEWLGHPISLELEHINGNHNDNRIENLKILCPNCHAQTPTYRGKNK